MRTIKHFLRSTFFFTALLILLLYACSSENSDVQSDSGPALPPTVNITNTSVIEGNTGESELVFGVQLSHISTHNVTVKYVTENDLADSASDFIFAENTLLIKAGSLSGTVPIKVIGDEEPEPNETMTLILSSATGANLGNAVATGTIIDDDVRILSVANTRVLEGDSGTSELLFVAKLDQVTTTDVTVDYVTNSGTATTEDNDFVSTNGTLTILAGKLSNTIAVTINGDLVDEGDETFTLELSTVSNNVILSESSAIATIAGDDRLLTEINLPQTGQQNCFDSQGIIIPCAATGHDGDTQIGIKWPDPRFSSNGNGTITDNLTNLIWPQDWNTSAAHLVTWQAALDHVNSLNAVSHLGFSDWRLPNRNELKSLLHYGVTENRLWLTDPAQGFSNVDDQSYWSSTTYEHITGSAELAWVIVMNADANYIGSANKSDTAGLAAIPVRGGSDYALAPVAKTGQVLCYDTAGLDVECTGTGQDGDLQLGYFWPTPRFTSNGDGDGTIMDNSTQFTWAAEPIGSGLNWQQALDRISDLNSQNYLGYNDWRMPNVNEIDSLINADLPTVTWLESFGFTGLQNINVWTSTTYRCVNANFCRPTQALVFATSATPWRALSKTTTNIYNYVWPVRGSNATQNLPEINIADVSIVEGNEGNSDLIFTLSLSTKSTMDVTLSYTSSDGSATVDEDYIATSGVLTIPADSLSNTVSISIVGDTLIESNETILLTLSDVTGALLVDSNAFGMIIDDEQINPIHLPKTSQKDCFDTYANVIPCAGTGQDGDLQSGVAWPNPRFVAQDNGTINDQLTGLFWSTNANVMMARDPDFDISLNPETNTSNDGLVDWRTAMDYIAKLNTELYLGFSDWRLPNRNELNSLFNFAQPNSVPFLQSPLTGFTDFNPKGYWTSTQDAFNIKFTWYLDFKTGDEGFGPFRAVLPVRSSQSIAPATLAKTGQTQCFNDEGFEFNCSGTGQDGEIQAGSPWPSQRFTNNNDGTVMDNLTGLMWAADGNIMSTRDVAYDSDETKDGAVSWQEALDYIAKLNAEYYLGYNDWRLPNIIEAQSRMFNQGLARNWLLPNGFTNFDFKYWTSSTYIDMAHQAWMFDKFQRDKAIKSATFYVWPIRGGGL